jgi:hypothetical protein
MSDESKIGAAILGLYAAIKICKREGYDVKAVLDMVASHVDEWDKLEESRQRPKAPRPSCHPSSEPISVSR